MPQRFKASSFNGLGSAFDNNLYPLNPSTQPGEPQAMVNQYGSFLQDQQSLHQRNHQQQQPSQHPQQLPQHHPHAQQLHQQSFPQSGAIGHQGYGMYMRASEPHFAVQPPLVRASCLAQNQVGYQGSDRGSRHQHFDSRLLNVKVTLSFQGDIGTMTQNWTEEERHSSRRLVLISWIQEYSHLTLSFRPISQKDYVPGMPVMSCIYWDETDRYYVTSVDLITILEHLVHTRFPVEEKNRIRRNLQSLKPLTISKTNDRFHDFFQLIMNYDCPKPRHIEKDVKVLHWGSLEDAFAKVLSKYTVDHTMDGPPPPIQMQGSGHMVYGYPGGMQPPTAFNSQTDHQYQESQLIPRYHQQSQISFEHPTHQQLPHPQQPPPPPTQQQFPPHTYYSNAAYPSLASHHQPSIVDPLTPAPSSNQGQPTPEQQQQQQQPQTSSTRSPHNPPQSSQQYHQSVSYAPPQYSDQNIAGSSTSGSASSATGSGAATSSTPYTSTGGSAGVPAQKFDQYGNAMIYHE